MSNAFFLKKGNAQPKDEMSHDDPTKPKTPLAAVDTVTVLDPESDLVLVRNMRATIINNLANGIVPTNSKDLAMMREIMNDMSRDSIGRLRIDVEKKQVDNAEQNRQLIQQYLSGDYIKPLMKPEDAPKKGAPTLPLDIETRDFVPGEDFQGTVNETIDTFAARTGATIQFADEDKPD